MTEMTDASAIAEARWAGAGREFARRGFVKLPFLVPEETKQQVAQETERLIPMLDWTVYRWSGPELAALAEYA
jgi:hypothetical protein